LPATVDERERAALRHDIARLLGGTAPAAVTIAVSSHDGQVRLEPCAEPDPVPAEGPAR